MAKRKKKRVSPKKTRARSLPAKKSRAIQTVEKTRKRPQRTERSKSVKIAAVKKRQVAEWKKLANNVAVLRDERMRRAQKKNKVQQKKIHSSRIKIRPSAIWNLLQLSPRALLKVKTVRRTRIEGGPRRRKSVFDMSDQQIVEKVCRDRKDRREAIMATGKSGSGSKQINRLYGWRSKIKC